MVSDMFGNGKGAGRPSFIEERVDMRIGIDRWLLEDIDLLIKIDRKTLGKVSRNWYIRNILHEYCRGRSEHLVIAREALKEVRGNKKGGA